MDELKDVLIFISFSFRKFFTNFLFYLAYFFPVLILTVFIFFYSYRSFGNYYFFLVYLVVMVIIHFLVKKILFLKRQLNLNLMFVNFLEKKDKKDFSQIETGNLSLKKLKEIKTGLKKVGAGFLPTKLLLAVAAIQLKRDVDSFDSEKLEKLKKMTFKFIFIEMIIFFIVLIPFTLISFLFTRGFVGSIQLLIYLLGFLFVYFLNSAIFDPIIYLIIQAHLTLKS